MEKDISKAEKVYYECSFDKSPAHDYVKELKYQLQEKTKEVDTANLKIKMDLEAVENLSKENAQVGPQLKANEEADKALRDWFEGLDYNT